MRFEQSGQLRDLDTAVKLLEHSLELLPPGDPKRSASLDHLAHALLERFQQLGQLGDLDKGLLLQSLELLPPGHPDRSALISITASALQERQAASKHVLEREIPGKDHPSVSPKNAASPLETHKLELVPDTNKETHAAKFHPTDNTDRHVSLDNIGSAAYSLNFGTGPDFVATLIF